LGKDYADTGITINALAPAVVRTAMVAAMPEHQVVRVWHSSFLSLLSSCWELGDVVFEQAYMTAKIPMARTGEISEIATLVAYIVSPDCSFTTGFTFDASGGRATY
jgi:2-dehydro-3-deoxy-L-rhamnonate dehydrogenase (NAD+)